MTHMKRLIAITVLGAALVVPSIYSARASSAAIFNNNLSYGISGSSDVTALQQFLQTQGIYSGPITGNFFSLTRAAVKTFQTQNNIAPTSGYFGPITRAKANGILDSGINSYNQAATNASSGIVTPATTSSTSTAASALQTVPSLTIFLQARIGNLFQQLQNLFGRSARQSSGSTAAPATTTAPAITSSSGGSSSGGGGGGSSGGSSSSGGGGSSGGAALVLTKPTSTLAVSVSVNGGTATVGNFNITVKDGATTLFNGTAASGQSFVITQGDSYSVTEATTSNSINYTVAVGSACSGAMPSASVTCSFVNAYIAPPVVTPTSTTILGGTDITAYVTGYGWSDNSPPGAGTYIDDISGTAGGTGTYSNPITIAVGYVGSAADFAPGTMFYIPNLRRYFAAEDTCEACHSDVPAGATVHLDVWVGGQGASASAVNSCEDAITANHLIIENPTSNYSVVPGSIFNGTCSENYGDIPIVQ